MELIYLDSEATDSSRTHEIINSLSIEDFKAKRNNCYLSYNAVMPLLLAGFYLLMKLLSNANHMSSTQLLNAIQN